LALIQSQTTHADQRLFLIWERCRDECFNRHDFALSDSLSLAKRPGHGEWLGSPL
jgi:hypothetical protein